ncbi:subtilase-type protease inhibitor [Streptomyces sp. NPDC004609]|uniref:subtilase-type protease inhibitor n=1 Tax=Streptomyces sp. NPDC004609 TaxID=3364704 RepID=UPI0036ADD507
MRSTGPTGSMWPDRTERTEQFEQPFSGFSVRAAHAVRAARGGAVVTAAAALALGGAVTGSARAAEPVARPAAASGLYAPSALVLTAGKDASTSVDRAVTLSCAPSAGGTHPAPEDACRELGAAGGDFTALPSALPYTMCTREWAPVTVTASGVWQGKRVDWSGTYNNGCEMQAALGAVFAF